MAVLVVTLAACTGGSSPSGRSVPGGPSSPPGDASDQAELDAIKQRLAASPAVVRVEGGYSHDPSNAGGDVMLAITVRRGEDLAAAGEAAEREVWRSRLSPVASMIAAVGPDDDPGATIYRHADFHDEWAALTARYGPRPTGP